MGFLFDPTLPAGNMPSFQPSQIVCLASENTRLYAEVVQLVAARKVCWVRPLVLMIGAWEPGINRDGDRAAGDGAGMDPPGESGEAGLDLRSCSDLLLPWVLFRAAMDTEVMPILTYLYPPECSDLTGSPADRSAETAASRARDQMHQFIHKICADHPEAFSGDRRPWKN